MTKYEILKVGQIFFELAAFATGALHFKKFGNSYWKFFIVYLGLLFCLDATGVYMTIVVKADNNWLYSKVIIPFEFLFFFWLLGKNFTGNLYRKLPFFFALMYAFSFVVDIIWLQKMKFTFSSFSYCIGNICLLVLIILFFLKFIGSEDILNYKQNGMFWVCIGLLTFYMGSLPFYGLWNTLMNKYPKLFNNYWIFQIGMDYLMYIFFSISFIWTKPK